MTDLEREEFRQFNGNMINELCALGSQIADAYLRGNGGAAVGATKPHEPMGLEEFGNGAIYAQDGRTSGAVNTQETLCRDPFCRWYSATMEHYVSDHAQMDEIFREEQRHLGK